MADKLIVQETKTDGLSAKDLALYIGVPVATVCLAGGLYYLLKSDSSSSEAPDSDKQSLVPSESVPVVKGVAVDSGDDELGVDASPLEQAQSAKSRGNKFFKALKFEKAIECYTRALELCPKENAAEISTFYQNRAASYEQLKSWDDVVEDSSKAIELNPRYAKALGRRARAYEALDEKLKCLEDITAVCLLDGFQNQNSLVLADRILKAIGKEKAEKYFKERKPVLPSGTFVRSYLDSFNKDIFTDFDFSEEEKSSPYYEAVQQMKNNEFESVVEICNKQIENEGRFKIISTLLRGTLYTLMSDVDKAIADYNIVIESGESSENNPLIINALIKRGSLFMQMGKDVECYNDFEKALKIDDKAVNAYHHRGQLYFLTERLSDAKKDFQRAIDLDPEFVAPRLQLGYCMCKLAIQMQSPSIMQEANATLEETTKKFPKSPEAWSLYGQLLQDQQQMDLAADKLDKSIELAPKNPTAYVYKALLLLQWKQDIDAAHKLISRAIELDPKCDFAYETLATLEVQKGNNEKAIEMFEKAVELVRTEAEMANTFSLLEASRAQTKITKLYGIKVPTGLV